MDTTCTDVIGADGLEEIQRLYQVKDQVKVLTFLSIHPFLVPLLSAVRMQLEVYFPNTPLSLEQISDPDEPIEQLFIGIATGLPVEQAIDRLRQFDREWWAKVRFSTQGKLCIDVA